MITAVVCSDDRMIYVYKKLHTYMNVIQIDRDTDFLTLPRLDAIILPVKGIDDQGYMMLYEQAMHVPALFWNIQKDMKIFCGMPCAYVERLSQEKEYYLLDERVVKENAILTAEGVLEILISSITKSLYEIQVDVIGYGNCGKAIAHMLWNLDVSTRVLRRDCKEDDMFLKLSHWQECHDVIINTSIQKVLDEKRMKSWKKKPVVIDIATPNVIDEQGAKRLGIPLIKAKNLPGRFCPESAGRIIADYVRGKLQK